MRTVGGRMRKATATATAKSAIINTITTQQLRSIFTALNTVGCSSVADLAGVVGGLEGAVLSQDSEGAVGCVLWHGEGEPMGIVAQEDADGGPSTCGYDNTHSGKARVNISSGKAPTTKVSGRAEMYRTILICHSINHLQTEPNLSASECVPASGSMAGDSAARFDGVAPPVSDDRVASGACHTRGACLCSGTTTGMCGDKRTKMIDHDVEVANVERRPVGLCQPAASFCSHAIPPTQGTCD